MVFAALVLALPLIATALSLGGQRSLDNTSAPLAFGLVTGLCVAIFLLVEWAIRRHRLTIFPDGLEVTTSFYRRRLSLAELDIARARVVDLSERPEFRPMLKTNGTSLPGFSSGWFRLRNRDKALVAITGGPRVLWVPTNQGYDLLLQPERPQVVLDRLWELAPPDGRG